MRLPIRLVLAVGMAAVLLASAVAPANAEFGLKNLSFSLINEDGSPASAAGTHPYAAVTRIEVNSHADPELGEVPDDAIKDLTVTPPAGLVANPTAIPPCSNADFTTIVASGSNCPDSAALGTATLRVGFDQPETYRVPVYNLSPAPGTAATVGMVVLGVPVTIDLGISQSAPYEPKVIVENVAQPIRFYSAEVTIWGSPASPIHDEERGLCMKPPVGDKCSAGLSEKPFLTTPRSCTGPLLTTFEVRSWQNPGEWLSYEVTDPGMSGCSSLPFAPRIAAQPTTGAAESASGLSFELELDEEGIGSPTGTAGSDIRKAVVALPEGMTANPSLAEGLASCTEAQLDDETLGADPEAGCPQASKIGEVEVQTPLLEGTLLQGDVFLATPYANPFGSLMALYITVREPEAGIMVKLAGRVDPDPTTGQLVTTIDDAPQLPVGKFRFRFSQGPRAPLVTPPGCGTYEARATFTPWANPAAPYTATSTFDVSQGPSGAPCPPAGTRPFHPGFVAGSTNNQGGAYSPFSLRLTRADGDQDLTRFDVPLPPGLLGKLAGVAQCSDPAIAMAKGRPGRVEQANPSCPAASEIGRVLTGAGVGSQLTYVPGGLYLAGPFGGAPLSIVAIVPAVAGPFDLGTVVVRQALRLDPRTGQVSVDSAGSDPIPHILAGIPLKVRDIRAYVDRPEFIVNPTSCNPFSIDASLWGGGLQPFDRGDDAPYSASSRFQAAGCRGLGFKPRLTVRLKGGTKRNEYPALIGTFVPRPGDANLEGVALRLPRSAFLEQSHIRTICTRVQFAARICPTGSVYGHATAYTPLLDQPLKGPVYLRSSNHELPDLVADLRGLVDVEAVARIDSVDGAIRATFTRVPDAPLTKVIVRMQGGKKGLLVNSVNLCAAKQRARANYRAHNGRSAFGRPVVRARCRSAE